MRILFYLFILCSKSLAQNSPSLPSREAPVFQVKIPKFKFSNYNALTVFAYFERRTRDLDPEKKGVKFIIDSESGIAWPKIKKIELNNISIKNSIHYCCLSMGLKYSIHGTSVTIEKFKVNEKTPRKRLNKDMVLNLRDDLKIKLPKVYFKNKPLRHVINQLRAESKLYTRNGQMINFVLLSHKNQKLSIDQKNISLKTVLKMIHLKLKLKVKLHEEAVILGTAPSSN